MLGKSKFLKTRFNTFLRGVVVLACAGLAGCQTFSGAEELESIVSEDVGTDGPKISFDSFRAKDPQSKLGAREHPKILAANGGAYEDEKLEALLAIITSSLVTHSDDPERAYGITVLNSPSVNAFALPGGYLYVTRGLLELANDASEVAAVLAHEMAHVSSNHGIERNRQAKAVDIADRVVSEVVTNDVAGKVALASTEQRLVSFSQRQELQADAIGIKMIGKAGFDPFAAARFLKSMERYANWRASSSLGGPDLSNTHPSTPQRIELARRHARLVGPQGVGKRNRDRFLQGIDGMLFGDSAKEGFVRGKTFAHVRLGIAFDAPNNFTLTNRADAVLAAGPDQMALRFDAVNKDGQGDAAQYLASGWVNGLLEETVTKRTINSMPAASARAQAGDWQFVVTVVERKNRYYRFILAAPKSATGIDEPGLAIPNSFRELSAKEKASLKPLRLRVVTVKRGDTPASLSKRMVGITRPEQLFMTLNGMEKDAQLKPGQKVKLVLDK